MENMSYEVFEAIKDIYSDDNKLVKDCLFYLYHKTTDNKLKLLITDWFKKYGYCIECGSKLQSYEWAESHDELEGSPNEYFSCLICPNCENAEFESEKEY